MADVAKPMSSCEPSSVVRVRMTVAYDGGPFHGFAENEGVITVGATLRRAIERVLGHPVTMGVAGRTDRGVHAWGQVVTFDADPARLELDVLQRAVNALCRPSIAVRDVAIAPADFHARFSAMGRSALAFASVVVMASAAIRDATRLAIIDFWILASPPKRRPFFGVAGIVVTASLSRACAGEGHARRAWR